MSITRTFRCDGPGCENNADTVGASPPSPFITVTDHSGGPRLHFCGWDCLLQHGAIKPPREVIE